MRYMGGKAKIAKELSRYINSIKADDQVFVDLFCGALNVASQISGPLVINDANEYLMTMWNEVLNKGWIPPDEVSEEVYNLYKTNLPKYDPLTAFIGFGCSFAGKFFGGYARSVGRNYAANAKNSTLKKKDMLHNRVIGLQSLEYSKVSIPKNAIVYCDIPYKETTKYDAIGDFDHDRFYTWLIENSEKEIYVSEYLHNVPDFCEVVWAMDSKKDMRDKNGEQVKTTEVLFRVKR